MIGCSGSFAGPDVGGQLLPRRGRRRRRPHLADPARPRQRRPRPAPAVRRPGRHRRRLLQPPPPRPLPRPVRLLRPAQVPPRRRAPADPGLGTGRRRRADVARLRPARAARHDRRVRLPRVRRARSRSGRSRSSRVAVAHPVPAYGLRVTADGRTLAYTGDTGPCEALDRLAAGADAAAGRGVVPRTASDNPDDLHLTGREAGEVAARNGVPRLVVTHVPPWYDADRDAGRGRDRLRRRRHRGRPGASYDL